MTIRQAVFLSVATASLSALATIALVSSRASAQAPAPKVAKAGEDKTTLDEIKATLDKHDKKHAEFAEKLNALDTQLRRELNAEREQRKTDIDSIKHEMLTVAHESINVCVNPADQFKGPNHMFADKGVQNGQIWVDDEPVTWTPGASPVETWDGRNLRQVQYPRTYGREIKSVVIRDVIHPGSPWNIDPVNVESESHTVAFRVISTFIHGNTFHMEFVGNHHIEFVGNHHHAVVHMQIDVFYVQ